MPYADLDPDNPNPFVRVKDTVTGHEYSVRTSAVTERHDVINKDAIDASGDPLPAKPSVSKGGPKNTRESGTEPTPSTASGPTTKE